MLASYQHPRNVRLENADKRPFWTRPGNDGIEHLADTIAHSHCGNSLRHLPLNATRRIPFRSAVLGNGCQFAFCIRRALFGQHRLDEPLSDYVGKATIGSRRMRVILHRQTKMANLWLAGELQYILTGSHELDHGQGEIDEVVGIGSFHFDEELVE